MKRHVQAKKAVSGKGKGKSSSSSSGGGGAEAPPPPSSSSLNNTRTGATRTVVLPSQTFCATPATVHTYPTKNKTIGAVVAAAATSKTPSSTSSTSAQRIATLRAALAKREHDVFHMIRSWISNRAHYNAVLASLGTRFVVVVDGADEVHPEGANEIIAPATPPPLNFASLRPEFTSVAAAALHHALKRLSEIPLASSSSSSSLNEMHQEVAAAVELVEAALPFCTRLPFRWQQQQQLSDGEGGHQQGNDENLIPHARCYSMYDLQCRLHAIQRLAAARSAWELGRQLQGASVRCIEEFYIFCRRWRLQQQQQQYVSPREHCEAAGLEIEVVNQSSNNTNNKQLLSITTMDTALYLSLKPPSCSSDSSNTLRRMSSAPRDDVNFVATQSLLQCMVGLINQHCQVSEGSWCRSSTLRKSDSSMVIPPFGVSGGAWIEVADELPRILRVTMQRRELLGLPLFLRSLRRHVTTATMSPSTSAPQITTATTPLYGSVVGSFFPSVAHLRDHEGFDLSRQVSGDYTIVDKEIREGVCDGSALQFVVVCGEADVMGKYLCEYCGCCGKDEDTKGTAVSRLWRTALSSSAVTSGSSSLRWVNNGNEITLVVAPGCTMLRPDVSHVAMVFGVIVPQHVGQHIKAEENRDPPDDVAAAADQQRAHYYMNTDSYLCAVIELKR